MFIISDIFIYLFQICYDVVLSLTLCHNLEQLNLSGVSIVDDACLMEIAENCPQLNSINIKACAKVRRLGGGGTRDLFFCGKIILR